MILIMPHHVNLYEGFVANLEKLNFDIELLFLSDKEFRYKNKLQMIGNFFRKKVLNDKGYKKKLKDKFDDFELTEALAKINTKADYTLLIRPDYFSAETIQLLKTKTEKLIAYQWDGLERYPKVKDLIPYFDKFFVFDVNDFKKFKSEHSNLFFTTNFFFDFEERIFESVNNDVFFVGSFIENRMAGIVNLTGVLRDLGLDTNINLLYFDNETPVKYRNTGINFIEKSYSYLEALDQVKKAKIVLDFADSVHNGLSFRIFESIGFGKKLITTNKLVKEYDFYHPDNIFILDDNHDQLKAFLKIPYQEIPLETVNKYGFSNWIKQIIS